MDDLLMALSARIQDDFCLSLRDNSLKKSHPNLETLKLVNINPRKSDLIETVSVIWEPKTVTDLIRERQLEAN